MLARLVGDLVWGSQPYTADSDMSVAVVHAGLGSPGQQVTIEMYNEGYYSNYAASTANGVTTLRYLDKWCGFYIRLA